MSTYPNVEKYDESGLPPALKPGNYVVKVDDIKTEDKDGNPFEDSNGDHYHNFIFTVKDAPNKLFEKFYLDPKGPYAEQRLGKFKQFLLAVGADPKGGEMSILLGCVCRADVTTREYKGKTYNNIIAFESRRANDSFGDDDLPY